MAASSTTRITFPTTFDVSSHPNNTLQVRKPLRVSNLRVRSSFVNSSHVVEPEETREDSRFPVGLPQVWRELQGCGDWEDLVEPLHPLLRNEIIRYGEFVAACYTAFDMEPSSKTYLKCKFRKTNLFENVGLDMSGYEVTKYVYAISDVNLNIIQNGATHEARWIGYVAVSNDETVKKLGRRDIVVAFRGTVSNSEWIANMMSSLTSARLDPMNPREEVKVESGFLSLYTSDERNKRFGLPSCRDQLLSEISRLIKKYEGEELSICLAGHSMGSSLAVLHAYDITELGMNKVRKGGEIPVTVYSFGGPRVGNLGFKERCEELGVKVLRVVNVNDPVTKVPGMFLNERNTGVLGENFEVSLKNWNFSCYVHVGVEIVLDFFNVKNPSCVHDLETYISLLKCPHRSFIGDHDDGEEEEDDQEEEGVVNKLIEVLGHLIEKPLKSLTKDATNFLQSRSTDYFLHAYVYRWLDSMNFTGL